MLFVFWKKYIDFLNKETSGNNCSSWGKTAEIKNHQEIFNLIFILLLWQYVNQNGASCFNSTDFSRNYVSSPKIT